MGKTAARKPKAEPIPPLRDGDRLDVAEYLRRYEADEVVHTAELLDGIVHVVRWRETVNGHEVIMPPISGTGHGVPTTRLSGFLLNYEVYTGGVESPGSVTTVLPTHPTSLEPDGLLRILPECGGRSDWGAKKCLYGVPELVAEVSYSSGARDLGMKYRAFEADGVPEYVVWRTNVDEVLWFVIEKGKYVRLEPDANGVIKSRVFPGLWLDVPALLGGKLPRVMATLNAGLASAEHAAFVAKLTAKAARKAKKK